MHLVGVQEGRCPKSKVFVVGDYIVATSAATPGGCYGNEVYIAMQWPTHDGRGAKIGAKQVNIAHAQPRLLYVTVRAGRLTFDIMVAHCPTSSAPGGNAKGGS